MNWVHGLGPGRTEILPPPAYLAAYMILLPLLVYVPMHLLLQRLFGTPAQARPSDRPHGAS